VKAVPKADLNYLAAHGTAVQQAQKDSPHQWQKWWWISFAGQLVFLPFVFLLAGRWSPSKAREDEQAHAAAVEHEMELLAAEHAVVP
jgi:hypothetical protein